jgi:lipoprotein-anchoring transpeptidase ErfK/SrfK
VTRIFGILRLLPCLAAALVAVFAILAAGVGSAAAAAAAPQLAATATPAVVVYPGASVISGTLTGDAGGMAGVALGLVQRPAGTTGEWLPAGSATTGADGAFSFRAAPSVSTDYEVRYPAGAAVPSASAAVSVGVQPRVTVSFPADLWLGRTVTLRGVVAPEYAAGTPVAIERKVDGVWQALLTTPLDGKSAFAVAWSPAEYGYYRLRARVEAGSGRDTGASAAHQVIVNRPNAHDVPLRYAHYIVIVRHEYRLYYYEHGVLVRGFDVALGRPGYRTPLGLFRIYGKRKPAGGALGACAMFYRRQGGIAIHGTNQPGLIRRPIPRDYSHGCARMLNRQVLWLYARVPVRTYVHNLR